MSTPQGWGGDARAPRPGRSEGLLAEGAEGAEVGARGIA